MNKAWLLVVLVLSGCSTITTEPPKDLDRFAEIDVKTDAGVLQVDIYGVSDYTGFGSRYFGYNPDRKQPARIFVTSGTFQLSVSCQGTIYLFNPPDIKVTVTAGKKYWLGCERGEHGNVYHLDAQSPVMQNNESTLE